MGFRRTPAFEKTPGSPHIWDRDSPYIATRAPGENLGLSPAKPAIYVALHDTDVTLDDNHGLAIWRTLNECSFSTEFT